MSPAPTPNDTRKRAKIITINVQQCLAGLTTSRAWFKLAKGVPEGAKVIGTQLDSVNHVLKLAVEHPSFDLVPWGEMLQEQDVIFYSKFIE